MLVGGSLKLDISNTISGDGLYSVYGYDSNRNKIYGGYSGINSPNTIDENNNPIIYRLNEDLTYNESNDKFTLPQGYSVNDIPTNIYFSEDANSLYFYGIVYDYITGETSQNGYSQKIVKINIDNIKLSDSIVEFFDYFVTGTIKITFIFEDNTYIYYYASDDNASNGLSLFRVPKDSMDDQLAEEYDTNFLAGGFSKGLKINDDEYILVRGYIDSGDGNNYIELVKYNPELKQLSRSNNRIQKRGIGQVFKISENRYELLISYNDGSSSIMERFLVDENLNFYGDSISTESNIFFSVNYVYSTTNILKVNNSYYFGNDDIVKLDVIQTDKSKSIISGSVVSSEQSNRNVPIINKKVYLENLSSNDISGILNTGEDSIIKYDSENEYIYTLNISLISGTTYIINKFDFGFNLLETFDTNLPMIRKSFPYVYSNSIVLTTSNGIYEIEIDSSLSNSTITQLNSYSQSTHSVSSNIFTNEIFYIDNDFIYSHSSTTGTDFDRYLKINKTSGNIDNSYDMAATNNQLINYFFDKNTYKLYHIRPNPNTNYKIFNFNNMGFDFDGNINISGEDNSGIFFKKVSDKIWKFLYRNSQNKLALKTVDVTNNNTISEIESDNTLSSQFMSGFYDKGDFYILDNDSYVASIYTISTKLIY